MPSIEDFRTKMASDANAAFTDYILHVDEMSLDVATDESGRQSVAEFRVVKVAFTFADPNVITMAASLAGTEMSYLPWKNAGLGGMARARLDGTGPAYFSTSQLSGCRFTVQYDDAGRTTATVLHLAGDVVGGKKPEGSDTRDVLQAANLPQGADARLRRSYSIGQMKPLAYKEAKIAAGTTLFYDGGKAAIFGYRNRAGVWTFYAAEERFDRGVGLTNLSTGQKVRTSITANASA